MTDSLTTLESAHWVQLFGLMLDVVGVVLIAVFSARTVRIDEPDFHGLEPSYGNLPLEIAGWCLLVAGFLVQGLAVIVSAAE